MTAIGGPGGIGGPSGPSGPAGAAPASRADDIAGDLETEPAHASAATELDAGQLTPREVTAALIDRLVETTGGPAMDATERAELRELLTDLVTNDPYLGGLVGRI